MAIPQIDLLSRGQDIITSSPSQAASLPHIDKDHHRALEGTIAPRPTPYLHSTTTTTHVPVIFTSPPSTHPHGPKPACVLSTTSKAQSTVSCKTLERFYPELVRIGSDASTSTSTSPSHTTSNQGLSTNSLPLSGGGNVWYLLITALSGLMGKLSWWVGEYQGNAETEKKGLGTGTGRKGNCTVEVVQREYVSLPIIVNDEAGKEVKFWIRARVVESEREGMCIGWGDLRKQGMMMRLLRFGSTRTPRVQQVVCGAERKADSKGGEELLTAGPGKVLINADRYGNVIAERENENENENENEKGNWLICGGGRRIPVNIVQTNIIP